VKEENKQRMEESKKIKIENCTTYRKQQKLEAIIGRLQATRSKMEEPHEPQRPRREERMCRTEAITKGIGYYIYNRHATPFRVRRQSNTIEKSVEEIVTHLIGTNHTLFTRLTNEMASEPGNIYRIVIVIMIAIIGDEKVSWERIMILFAIIAHVTSFCKNREIGQRAEIATDIITSYISRGGVKEWIECNGNWEAFAIRHRDNIRLAKAAEKALMIVTTMSLTKMMVQEPVFHESMKKGSWNCSSERWLQQQQGRHSLGRRNHRRK